MTARANKILHCSCLVAFMTLAQAAKAEDQDYITNTPNSQQAATHVANDQQYKMPNYYNGKYYPDDESIIGHGTSNTAQNQNQNALDGNGSYYYYYY